MNTATPSSPAGPASPAPEAAAGPCVYYDGACPLCSREIATYQRAQGGDQLQWVDAATCPAPALGAALPREDALARLHVRLPDGRLLSGAAAFVAIWQRLPAFRALTWLARVPGAVWVMEMLYRGFLAVRPLWRPRPLPAETTERPSQAAWLALPRALRRELRTDHAGEAGAVMIYRGVLALARDPDLRAFAQHHLQTEQQHLALIEAVVPRSQRSRLLPLWLAAGWLTGALPALFGPRAVYATIEAVETFVDTHYADQVAMIDALRPAATAAAAQLPALRDLLETCRLDEVAHRDDAHARRGAAPASIFARVMLRVWAAVVGAGSAAAVRVSRHV